MENQGDEGELPTKGRNSLPSCWKEYAVQLLLFSMGSEVGNTMEKGGGGGGATTNTSAWVSQVFC